MKLRLLSITALLLITALLISACGLSSQPAATTVAPETTAAPETTTAAPQTTAAPETTTEATTAAPETTTTASETTAAPETTTEAETTAASSEIDPYAWQGLEDMPRCTYLDIFTTYHYITVYDTYVSSFVTEETYAVDGINSFKENSSSLVYSINGKATSINKSQKFYIEMDLGDAAAAAQFNLEAYIAAGENMTGRKYEGTGKDIIPLYCDHGDTAEYEYYEYTYPDYEAMGTTLTERFYMKDGDVFAIYTLTTYGDSSVETTQVIKSMSGDIPEGTFELPDLSEYELREM